MRPAAPNRPLTQARLEPNFNGSQILESEDDRVRDVLLACRVRLVPSAPSGRMFTRVYALVQLGWRRALGVFLEDIYLSLTRIK